MIEIFSFKEGQELNLDDIYNIQGLAGGDWWEHKKVTGLDIVCPGDDIIITCDVDIKIESKRSK